MGHLSNQINREIRKVELQLNRIEQIKPTKEGWKVKVQHKRNQYFYSLFRTNRKSKEYEEVYLKKKDIKLAKEIVQYNYNEKVTTLLEQKLYRLKNLKLEAVDDALENAYHSLPDGKKLFVSPFKGSVADKVKQWLAEEYEENTSYPDGKTFSTERGEFVRSKSEAFIANFLFQNSAIVDYKYERPLTLTLKKKKYTIYPDFTIINLKSGRIFILEHIGGLDYENYRANFVWKHNLYIANGYVQNHTLLYTFEVSEKPIDIDLMKKLISEVIFAE